MHALAYCSTASQCWEKAPIQLPLQQETSFVDWCVTVFNTATVETRKLFCTLCWALWSARNDKVNVDASIFGSSQDYGDGIVARDEHGYMLEGVSRLCHGNIRPELAEAIGVREALSWIKDKQWPNVILETDCLVVVQAIRSLIHMISFFGDYGDVPTDMLPFLVAEFEV
uniref:RNase H type-1 domain-containing protein n=1 Tax=Cannabis sativa TaxID=3483 RepID=A0A803QAV1_CANSA